MRLSSEFAFDAAHRLMGARDDSGYLHRHTYRLEVEVEGERLDGGRMTAEDLQAAVRKALEGWENATLLWFEDPLITAIDRVEDVPREKVVYLSGNPTNELLAGEASTAISGQLPSGIKIERVTVDTTRPCPRST
jgi:6-pyruvoyl-tetrahydropterin synthase